MPSVSDWLPPTVVGVTFLTLALLKVYGFHMGVVGGGGKPALCRLLGRCPSWSPMVNNIMVAFFFVLGAGNLVVAALAFWAR
ncbi:hypothetical protein [Verrucomicrobium sp. BvORR106]|uniref:hypothetical protein n=1 Tax=Verrucomicrobium sp. BvORR106 TaxID=1403819 RepID=UPI00056EBCE7|nr:hypothetical protein [Verrucomicrobium sp. BvORR106]